MLATASEELCPSILRCLLATIGAGPVPCVVPQPFFSKAEAPSVNELCEALNVWIVDREETWAMPLPLPPPPEKSPPYTPYKWCLYGGKSRFLTPHILVDQRGQVECGGLSGSRYSGWQTAQNTGSADLC